MPMVRRPGFAVAALVRADDAVYLDSTGKSLEQVIDNRERSVRDA